MLIDVVVDSGGCELFIGAIVFETATSEGVAVAEDEFFIIPISKRTYASPPMAVMSVAIAVISPGSVFQKEDF